MVVAGDFSGVNASLQDSSHAQDAAFSFEEFDVNKDGQVDWHEWSHMMYNLPLPPQPPFLLTAIKNAQT